MTVSAILPSAQQLARRSGVQIWAVARDKVTQISCNVAVPQELGTMLLLVPIFGTQAATVSCAVGDFVTSYCWFPMKEIRVFKIAD
jgi:hypothetical protein